jgi:undecaprenyl pyrophosphate synthase
MTKQEVVESMVRDVKKHLEEYEYCTIRIARKGKEVKAIIETFEGDFETVTSTSGTTIEIESEETK